jgi:hypothetical protein
MTDHLRLVSAISWDFSTPLGLPMLVLLCLLVGAIGIFIFVRNEIIDNSEAPIFDLVRYVGRTAIGSAIRKILRLAPIMLISGAIGLALLVPELMRGGDQADHVEIEQQIVSYLSDAAEPSVLAVSTPNSVNESVHRTRELPSVQHYQTMKIGDIHVDLNWATVRVQLTEEDGATVDLLVVCRRNAVGWHIWNADFQKRITTARLDIAP